MSPAAEDLLKFLGPASARGAQTRRMLQSLPPLEQVCIRFHVDDTFTQEQVAFLLKVSQPTVSYGLRRALERLVFLQVYRAHPRGRMKTDLKGLLSVEDLQILQAMVETVCQLRTAHQLGVSQGKVRYRMIRALELLERHRSPHAPLLRLLLKHPNILGGPRKVLNKKRCLELLEVPLSPRIAKQLEKLREHPS